MKKQAWTVFTRASFLVLLGASAASAQSILLRADIPFDFHAEKQTFPAGNYTITAPGGTGRGVLMIKNETPQLGTGMVRTSFGADSTRTVGKTQLLFNQYGDRYWLSQVWYGDGRQGYHIRKSPQERELAKEFAEKTGAGPQVVSVALAAK